MLHMIHEFIMTSIQFNHLLQHEAIDTCTKLSTFNIQFPHASKPFAVFIQFLVSSSIIELANSLAAAGTSYIPPERTLSIASRSQSIIATSSLRVEDEIESTHNMCYAVI